MSVLDSIIEGVREDLAARRLPMGQLHEALEIAPAVRDCLPNLTADEISVIAEVIALSHATAACEPCPNSKFPPLPIVTLAAKVVATSGPIVAIKSPAIIFLVR